MYRDRQGINSPANTTYRARTTAHQPLNWRGLACFSRCTAPDLFSPCRDRLRQSCHVCMTRLVTD